MLFRSSLLALFVLMVNMSDAQMDNHHRITLDPSMHPFYHGVESGDPMPDRVILWTRVTPDSGMLGNIDVYWQIATDTNFMNIVNYGKAIATEDNQYCVKADVCGLQPATYYYYMFQANGANSIIGRTKTAPDANSDVDSVRFAVVSCASWEHGYFNAYQSIANRNDVDAVVHLGDYIYEYASGDFSANLSGRTYDPPTEAVTEVGYELRYSQYKLDKQLQRAHQLYPFITVWDDHETANDAWSGGAQNHQPATEGSYSVRKHNSTSVYFKWMPIRKPDPADTIRIFRKLRYGKLLDLVMLDTRLYDRDEQNLGAANDPTRHIMGPVERAWFMQQLDDTTTRWKIIGNQVMFAPLTVFGQPVNADQWDGYSYERGLIEDHIMNNNIKNVVILTGDIHTTWCNDVPGPNYDPNTGAGSVCVEFVGTSVTSAGSPLPVGMNIIKSLNPHMKYIDLTNHGYYVLDIKKGKTQADYTYMSTVTSLGATDGLGPSYYVNNNERFLRQGTAITNAPKIQAALPPIYAKQNIGVVKITDHYVVTPENTQVIQNILPGNPICPAVVMSVAVPPAHGGVISLNGHDATYVPVNNYNGYDTVAFAICTLDTVPVCDTVYLFVVVTSEQTLDTITVDMKEDSSYYGCVSFDDLTLPVSTFNNSQTIHGTINVSDTCFTYTPDTSYRGIEWITFIGCDSLGECDTVVYKIKVDYPVNASEVALTLNKNSNISYCVWFDDLVCQPATVSIAMAPSHGTFQLSDGNCLKYFPYYNYIGDDTLVVIGCDTCGLHYCDTVSLIYQVEEPNAIADDHRLVVFGMFPNPVGDKLIVQYYLYEAADVQFNVYNMAGKLISTDNVYHPDYGLQYAQLNTTALSTGSYVVEVKAEGHSYRKQVIKQ